MATPFDDLDAYISLPRLSGLAISPDARRLVTTVATLNEDKTKYTTALWEIDPTGARPARRLTHGARGESAPVFTASGDLLFTSAARPNRMVTTTSRSSGAYLRLGARRTSPVNFPAV